MFLGHDPYQISIRHAIRYNEYAEDLWEHRASIITKGIGDAFS